MRFLIHWVVVMIALAVTAWLLPGVNVQSFIALAIGGLVLGFVNAIVRPVLQMLSLPITLLTLGLFLFVVNGIAFGLAAWLTPGFQVSGLWSAILGSLLVSLVSWILGAVGMRADDRAAA